MRAAVIINPVAGVRRAPSVADRARLAAEVLASRGIDADIHVTHGRGHASDLARAAVAQGAELVVAWGGDGTVNEVGRTLVAGPAALAIVPAGSGNGLARALKIPRDPRAALLADLDRPVRTIDAGEIDGHVFLNVAGIGLEAHVAHTFATASGGRGLRRYLVISARGLLTYRPSACRVCVDDAERACRPLLLTIANGPEWGNGARIAPGARLDDGLLDLVAVEPSSRLRAIFQTPRLFTGTIARAAGVTTIRVARVRVIGESPMLFHVDGEPMRSRGASIDVRVLPAVLRVRG